MSFELLLFCFPRLVQGTERIARVIAYTLLCGYSPFRSDDKNELVKETTRGKIVFHERYWRKVSETGKPLPPISTSFL